MAQILTRRDIWSLEDAGPWHPITEAWARAIAVMQSRDDDDPTSWAHQAAIHGSSSGDWREQCQHNSWHFLPWHRMYLYWFEQIVREALRSVPEVGEDVRASWALPYWDYGRNGHFAGLPAAFRERTLPDGTAENPLFVAQRAQFVNDGEAFLPTETDASRALGEAFFSTPQFTGGFGGAATGRNHFSEDPDRQAGSLELAPHNVIHSTIGGLMGDFDTAGLDPVFWMHHANIDRLWSVWMGRQGHQNPGDQRWTSTPFSFSDPSGTAVKKLASAVVDSEAGLQYTYENLTAPAAPAAPGRRMGMTSEHPPDHPPELVGASDAPVELSGDAAAVAFAIAPAEGPARRGVTGTSGGGQRVYLNVEGVQAERDPGVAYGVYLNLPDEDGDHEPERHHVGNVSFFGIEKASDPDRDDAHGMRYAFDVTDVVAGLRDSGHWDPESVKVTFEPLRRKQRRGIAGASSSSVSIGRVGLYLH